MAVGVLPAVIFFMERGDNSMSDDGLIEIWLLDKRIHEERMKEIKEKEQV